MSSRIKDGRIWVKISVDFHSHPKMFMLSPAARDAFVEMLCYSHNYQLDGVIPQHIAKQKWGTPVSEVLSETLSKSLASRLGIAWDSVTVLDELQNNDPITPSLARTDDGDFVIYGYADYQETRATINARKARNTKAGRLGGKAKAKQDAKQDAKHSAKQDASNMPSNSLSENVADKRKEIRDIDIPNGISIHTDHSDASAGNDPRARTKNQYAEEFENFWQHYPRKDGKYAASVEFAKARKLVSLEELIEAARWYRDNPGTPSGQYAHAKTWLHNRRWTDRVEKQHDAPTITPQTPSSGGYRSQNQIMADMRNSHHAPQQGDATRLIEGGW